LYDKGGAAYIAKTIHEGLLDNGLNATYLAGYPDSKSNKINYSSDVKFSSSKKGLVTLANFFAHKIIGKDLFSPFNNVLTELVKEHDIIICHTLHSHWISYEYLFNVLKKYSFNKKIFFVAHDSWHYTGRCAFIFDCDNWKNNCLRCNYTSYYPSTTFSISNSENIRKRNLINSISNLEFISPANWICDDLKEVYKQIPIHLVRNGIDTSIYNNIPVKKANKDLEFCVSCVDFSQKGKVDMKLIKKILDLGFKIHFIGKNNPFSDYTNAVNYGYVSNKEKYLEILSSIDCYLFTSEIDIYPTVLVDAICAGNIIIYTRSKGALEIMQGENHWLGYEISDIESFSLLIKNNEFNEILDNLSLRKRMKSKACEFYSIGNLVQNYKKLFASVLIYEM